MNATKLLCIIAIGLAALVLLGIMGNFFLLIFHPQNTADLIGKLASWMVLSFMFYGFPVVVSGIFAAFAKKPASLVILAVASVLYGVFFRKFFWFLWFTGFPLGYNIIDDMDFICYLHAGLHYLPLLVPLWIVALIVEAVGWWRYRRRIKKGDEK